MSPPPRPDAPTGLVPAPPAPPAPPAAPARLTFASSLDTLTPGSMILVDKGGAIRSRAYFVARGVALGVGMGGLFAALLMGANVAFGLLGVLALYLAGLASYVGWWRWFVLPARRVRRALALCNADRLDEADAVLRGPWPRSMPAQVQRLCHQAHFLVAYRRGDSASALPLLQRLRQSMPPSWQPALGLVYACSEVGLLATLDRIDEARGLYVTLRDPVSEVEVWAWWEAGLYLAFCNDSVAHTEIELWDCARRLLAMKVSRNGLALCAWALGRHGDADGAAMLLREAYERTALVPTARTSPKLWAWMQAHRPKDVPAE